jgi:hypothetical protein
LFVFKCLSQVFGHVQFNGDRVRRFGRYLLYFQRVEFHFFSKPMVEGAQKYGDCAKWILISFAEWYSCLDLEFIQKTPGPNEAIIHFLCLIQ